MIIMFLIITGVAVGRGLLGAVPAGISAAEFASNPAYAGFQHLGDLLNVGTETTTNWVVWAFLRIFLLPVACISFFPVFVSSLVRLFRHLRFVERWHNVG